MDDAGGGESRRGVLAAAAVIALAGAAAYANGLSGPFVFDDKGAIVRNESIRDLASLGDVLGSATYATVIGRPILNLSLALSYAVNGLGVTGWHVVNVMIHLASGLALFGVARRTLLAPRAPASLVTHATGLAFAISLLWTVHPLQTESVTYVCQRAESLSGFLVLVTLYCAIRGADSPRGRIWTMASAGACLVAVGTKESAAAAPLLVLLHDRAFVAGSFREALRRRPGLYAGLAATWLVLGALVLSSAGRAGSAGLSSGVGVAEYAATQPRAIVTYLRLAAWPHPLIFDRGAALATTAGEIVPYAALVTALVAGTAMALRTRPQLGFLGAWIFLILAPSSSVVPLATQTVAEHRMYLPLAAVVTLAVVAFHALTRARAVLRAPVLVVAAGALAWTTHVRNRTYRDELTLWCDTADRAPDNERAQVNAGACLVDAGESAAGLARFEAAIRLAPKDPMARVYLGSTLLALGRADASADAFTEMLRDVPEFSAIAYDNRGLAHRARGRTDLALADFDAAVRDAPAYARAYANRARLRRELGDAAGAQSDEEACRRLGFAPEGARP